MQKELEQNIDKRQSNYEYFAWKMEMDKKYDEIMNDKVIKLKIENERKKMVLIKQKAEDKMKKEENELKSYTIKKK